MNLKVEKRKSFLINLLYFAVMLLIAYFVMHYALGYLAPFFIALIVALILQKPINLITKKTKIKRGIVSSLCVVFLLLIFGSLLAVLILMIINELQSFFSFLAGKLSDIPALFEEIRAWIKSGLYVLPNSIEGQMRDYINSLSPDSLIDTLTKEFQMSWLSSPISVLWSTTKQIPNLIIATFVTIISSFFMTADFPVIAGFIYRQLPRDKAEKLSKSKTVAFSSLGKMFKAYAIIILITATELFLGLSILRLLKVYDGNYIAMICIITAFIDVIPVLGTGTVLLPWGIISLMLGNIGLGIGVLAIYGVVTVIRQIIEPKLVAAQVGLPAVVTILGMYVGIKIFGPIGIFVLPLLIVMFKQLSDEGLIHVFKTVKDYEDAKSAVTAEEKEE